MRFFLKAAVPVFSVAVLAFAAPSFAQVQQRPFPTLTVTGEGNVTAAPDIAVAGAGVSSEAKSPREAAEANARVMSAVMNAARQAGIGEADIRTSRVAIAPVMANRPREGGQQVVGYRATNEVQLRIRELGKVGEILDQLIAAGATNINGVDFGFAEPTKLLDEARNAAFADAKRKADLYARAAGAQIGRVLMITEGEQSSARAPRFRAAARSASQPTTPVAAGEDTLSVDVTVAFELLH